MHKRATLSRRTVLRLASATGVAAIAPAALGDETADLSTFNPEQATTLAAVSRTLFPHDFLENDIYMGVVETLDAKAAAEPDIRRTLQAGLLELEDNFAAMPEAARESALAQMQRTAFFRMLYDETLNGLYRDPEIARLLGNEGSSLEFGGFIERGFDDIDWLPDV